MTQCDIKSKGVLVFACPASPVGFRSIGALPTSAVGSERSPWQGSIVLSIEISLVLHSSEDGEQFYYVGI